MILTGDALEHKKEMAPRPQRPDSESGPWSENEEQGTPNFTRASKIHNVDSEWRSSSEEEPPDHRAGSHLAAGDKNKRKKEVKKQPLR